jgi:alpha/beta superfamily hydrolase
MSTQASDTLALAREEIERLRSLAHQVEERKAREKQVILLLAFGSLVALAIASAFSPITSLLALAAASGFVAFAYALIRFLIFRNELNDIRRLDRQMWASREYIAEVSSKEDELLFRNMLNDIVQGRDLYRDRYDLLVQATAMCAIPLGTIIVRFFINT